VHLNRLLDAEEAETGVVDGLREAGLVEGRDFDKTVRDAQGDMATVSSQMDAALADRSDLIIPFSTPALQAALQRVKRVPVVFNYVADAIAAGAGPTVTSHVPNVTGVYLIGAYAQMPALMPYGIDVNPADGSIWYSSLMANRIGRIDPDTLEVKVFAPPTLGPRRMRFAPDGAAVDSVVMGRSGR